MGSRPIDKGFILLDTLLLLFVVSIFLLSTLGLFSRLLQRTAETASSVRREIEMRNDHARERTIQFGRE